VTRKINPEEKRFPLAGVKSLTPSGKEVDASIPWALVEPHRRQARSNHGQSLESLASQGGLEAQDLVAVLRDKGPKYALSLTEKEALIIVHKIVQGFFKGLKATEQFQGKIARKLQ
jgi:hypothetical protein